MIGTNSHDILETSTKIQFHHNILNLTNPKLLTNLISFSFNEIELDFECEPVSQPCDSVPIFESMLTLISLTDLDPFPEPTLILVSMDFETEPPILDSHISLMGNECELQFFDLEPTIESKPTLKPKLDFPESVLVSEPIFLSQHQLLYRITFFC